MIGDITFCFNRKCKNKECERHMNNIKDPYSLHSFAFFKDCEWWDLPDERVYQSKEHPEEVTE